MRAPRCCGQIARYREHFGYANRYAKAAAGKTEPMFEVRRATSRLIEIVSARPMNMGSTPFESQEALLQELAELRRHFYLPKSRSRLKSLLAPTGPLQDLSIGNDWSEDYMRIAKVFD